MELVLNGWKLPALTVLLALGSAITGGLISAMVWQAEINLRVESLSEQVAEAKAHRWRLDEAVNDNAKVLARIDGQLTLILTRLPELKK